MFNLFKKAELLAPVTGKAIPVTQVQDPVFRDKVLGDGIALVPEQNEFFAPCDGTIVQIAHTKHAICIESDDGAEILLHLGMDTVKLDGEGFNCHVQTGDKVNAGQHIIDMDLDLVSSKGFDLTSPCIITNISDVSDLSLNTGNVVHGETAIIKYKRVKK